MLSILIMKHWRVVLIAFTLIEFFVLEQAKAQQRLEKLTDGVYVHISTQGGQPKGIPANGLAVITHAGVVLIDATWDSTQCVQLLNEISHQLKRKVVMALISHHHADRVGGVPALLKLKIPVYSTPLVARLAEGQDIEGIQGTLINDTTLTIGGVNFQIYYPGAGHSLDNIVVYLPGKRVLYGGCFVKDAAAKDLGNIADADLEEWPASLRKVQQKFGGMQYVVPGHNQPGDMKLLEHTLKLLEERQGAD